jgi:hypothetical protein
VGNDYGGYNDTVELRANILYILYKEEGLCVVGRSNLRNNTDDV